MTRIRAFLLSALILMLAADLIGTQAAQVPRLQLFLLAGQSNMAGRGTVEFNRNFLHARMTNAKGCGVEQRLSSAARTPSP
jgi:hypothetical protein